jgi:hypothetical protein
VTPVGGRGCDTHAPSLVDSSTELRPATRRPAPKWPPPAPPSAPHPPTQDHHNTRRSLQNEPQKPTAANAPQPPRTFRLFLAAARRATCSSSTMKLSPPPSLSSASPWPPGAARLCPSALSAG